MLISQKTYDKWKELVQEDLQIDRILPRMEPLSIKEKQKKYKRVEWHKRMSDKEPFDLLEQKNKKEERELPVEYKRGLTFNDAYITLCPNPFSVDLFRGGHVCYGCIYCLTGDTPILMSDKEEKKIKDIKIGDKIIGYRGGPVVGKVLNTMTSRASCYEITLENREFPYNATDVFIKIRCTRDHLWLTEKGYKNIIQIEKDKLKIKNVLNGFSKVVRVRTIGIRKVYDLTTTTENFVASGLVSHNCFSIRCETALLSSFYDNWKEVLVAPLNIETLEKQFSEAPYKTDTVSKAINRRLVLHAGNNIENYIPHIEKRVGIGYKFLELMKDLDYPVILNTKSDIWDQPKYFKVLSEMDNVMVQETILSHDDKVGEKIEPFAPSVTRRFEVVKKLNESGIRAVVRSEPYMYTISPTLDKDLDKFVEKLIDSKVPYINIGAYNTSVQSVEISFLFAQSGYSFTNLLNSQMGFYQTLALEKALFRFRDAGIKVGSFNPATYALQDSIDCCGFNMQGEPVRTGLDKFNCVEVAMEIMKRGFMDWDTVLRWAQPIYPDEYIQRFSDFWHNEPFANVWWGPWSFGGRVHGMIPEGDGFRFDEKEILDKRLHMKEAVL